MTVTDAATPDGIDNGILGSVPGQYIGAAASQCPDAQTATTDAYNVTIDAGSVGRVLITCRRVHAGRSHVGSGHRFGRSGSSGSC